MKLPRFALLSTPLTGGQAAHFDIRKYLIAVKKYKFNMSIAHFSIKPTL
jgi:hypothetical protein